jgi:hypothetical protein
MLSLVDDVFFFIFIGVYVICSFSRFFLDGSLSPPSSDPPTDVFLVSIPLALFFILDGVLLWDIVSELGLWFATSMSCCMRPSLVLLIYLASFQTR